jgi:nitrogen fixation protein NifU and related proteins
MMDNYYREVILDHYRRPHNAGILEEADIHAADANPLCGDKVELFLKLGEDGRVSEVRFNGRGCAISQASASLLTDMIEDKTPEELKQLGKDDILDALGLENISPARMKCAMLSMRVLHQALGDNDWFRLDDED